MTITNASQLTATQILTALHARIPADIRDEHTDTIVEGEDIHTLNICKEAFVTLGGNTRKKGPMVVAFTMHWSPEAKNFQSAQNAQRAAKIRPMSGELHNAPGGGVAFAPSNKLWEGIRKHREARGLQAQLAQMSAEAQEKAQTALGIPKGFKVTNTGNSEGSYLYASAKGVTITFALRGTSYVLERYTLVSPGLVADPFTLATQIGDALTAAPVMVKVTDPDTGEETLQAPTVEAEAPKATAKPKAKRKRAPKGTRQGKATAKAKATAATAEKASS